MPFKQNKRRSVGQVLEATPNMKQISFPSRKRTVKSKSTPQSAPRIRQQTITQMDPFYSLYHPNSDVEELKLDGEGGNKYEYSPERTKRRKITPVETPVRKMQTRSAKKKSEAVDSQPEEKGPSGDQDHHTTLDQETFVKTSLLRKTAALMPPPKTPQKTMRTEIPSSQSPPDTPLSTQSRRSVRETFKSPLKERSTNITTRMPSMREGTGCSLKGEVANGMEGEEADSPTLTCTASLVESCPSSTEVGHTVTEDPPPATSDDTSKAQIAQRNHTEPSNDFPSRDQPQRMVEQKILDSDDSDPPLKEPQNTHSDSQEASAQILGDLRSAQEGVETDSQLEIAWRSNVPPPASDPQSELSHISSSPTISTETFHIQAVESHTESTNLPTQFTHLSTYHSLTPYKPLIPPSQATTVDQTQASSYKDTRSLPVIFSPLPPMPPPPSSPGFSRKVKDALIGYEWDGVPLTDSQLLPESLMDDSMVGLPVEMGFMREDLGEEEG